MSDEITIASAAGASTNDHSITFSASSSIEFMITPEKFINKDISSAQLESIDALGVYISDDGATILIPWSNIKALVI